MSVRDVFQRVSYLQYPALLVAVAYAVKAAWSISLAGAGGWSQVFDDGNYVLLYAGVGIGLSSLQDPTRTQNDVSRRVWQDARKGRWMLALIGQIRAGQAAEHRASLGLVAFGLGMVGLLKTAIEMREHHRLDKQSASSSEGSRA